MPSSDKFTVSEPLTDDDFRQYYKLRFDVLRAPWGQPPGTEKDNEEVISIHACVKTSDGNIIGVCRMQDAGPGQVQLRYMAVDPNFQGKGIGKLLLDYLENKALRDGKSKIILQARENAVRFYERNGYTVTKKTHLLFGEIQHFLMEKELNQKS